MKATLVFLSVALASGASANPQATLPTVDLGYQVHRAISFNETYKTYNFSNIPFAEPPLGKLRFKAPIPPRGRKSGIQDGRIGKICPQANPDWLTMGSLFSSAYAAGKLPFNVTQAKETLAHLPPPPVDDRISEDCLVLDVVVPKTVFDARNRGNGKGKAPVLVWIFAGGFVIGDKNLFQMPHDLTAATQQHGDGAIWVAMNYRLRAFGFLSGPTLQQNGTANVGLYDQRLALEWVQRNIHKFGGDPDNVTVMGISAGAGSLMHQITAYGGSKPAPFRRAIQQSGGNVPITGNQQQEDIFNKFLTLLNVSSLDEARALPSSALMAANAKQIADAPYGSFVYAPAIDGDFVPGMPSKLVLQGAFAKDISIFASYERRDGILFTDPSAFNNETLFRRQIRALLPSVSEKNLDFVFKTLYPAKYDGSHPYNTPLERAQLLIAESAIMCNENAFLKSAVQQRIPAFGYQFSIHPALHGNDQSYIFSNGPTQGVDPEVASILKYAIAGFVTKGLPDQSPISKVSIPPYREGESILNVVINGSTVIRDPAANERCNWWQKALYY